MDSLGFVRYTRLAERYFFKTMHLNLPILNQISRCKNVLIAGMGGGFDLFCGLPVYFELQRHGQQAHLANFSFSNVESLRGGIRLTPTLVGVQAGQDDFSPYFPELYLAEWFQQRRQESVTIWSFHKTGTRSLLENYRFLVDRLAIDGILLIDGGVDSLVRGDESQMGTLVEDAISLFVVNQLTQVPVRIMGCLGLTIEYDVAHNEMLENMAALIKAGGYLGGCSLVPQMPAYQDYADAVFYVHGKRHQDPSVINSCIISATQGEFGDHHLTEKTRGSPLAISPLMALYWFFDLATVAKHNYILPTLSDTDTFMDTAHVVIEATSALPKRKTPRMSL